MVKAGSQPGKTASGKNGFTFWMWVNSVIQITDILYLSSFFLELLHPCPLHLDAQGCTKNFQLRNFQSSKELVGTSSCSH